jgi:hypothetical protein
MPVKMRKRKRRTDPAAELEAWSMLFECGYDYFNNLGFGYGGDAVAREAAPEAWRRLGSAFLASRPANAPRAVPWALETLGEPPQGAGC